MTSVVATAVLVPTAQAAPAPRTVARPDSAVVASGASVTVKVLANDSTTGAKSKAKVTITGKSWRLTTVVTKSQRIKVTPKASTKPGRYFITYRVTSKGQRSTARLHVRVKAKAPASAPAPAAGTSLLAVITSLPQAAEVRTGYDRHQWKHWNAGAIATDGCDTRSEILISEAVVPVKAGTKCPLTKSNTGGGSWFSYYDGLTVTNPTALDIDHMVPLAEAHDSGGWAWDAATREAYANDLGDPRSLVAVSASSNRSKSDRDPAEWLPEREQCRYASEWVAVKARWKLAVDTAEKAALTRLAKGACASTTVVVIPR